MPFHRRATHTHSHSLTHSDGDNADIPVHLRCIFLGCGRNWSPQKTATQTWGEHANSTGGPGWESIFPSQHYNEVTSNNTLRTCSPFVNDKEKPFGEMPTNMSFCFCNPTAFCGEIHWAQLQWRFKDDWCNREVFAFFRALLEDTYPHSEAMCGLGWSKGRLGFPPQCKGPTVEPPSSGHVCSIAASWGHMTLARWISRSHDLVLSQRTLTIMDSGLKSVLQRKRLLVYMYIIHRSWERIRKMKCRGTRK